MNAHLGVLKVGDKVQWRMNYLTQRGRIVRFDFTSTGKLCLTVDVLPYRARTERVQILARDVEKCPSWRH